VIRHVGVEVFKADVFARLCRLRKLDHPRGRVGSGFANRPMVPALSRPCEPMDWLRFKSVDHEGGTASETLGNYAGSTKCNPLRVRRAVIFNAKLMEGK
jgi:hypothetical protein